MRNAGPRRSDLASARYHPAMAREPVSTADAPAAIGPYSQAHWAGSLLFLSGQIPLAPDGTAIEGDIQAQARQVMENIGGVLRAAGLDYGHIVKTTIFLRSMDDFAAVNEVYGSYFIGSPPARSTVAV